VWKDSKERDRGIEGRNEKKKERSTKGEIGEKKDGGEKRQKSKGESVKQYIKR
jgi:hypothetical protein